MKKEKFLFVPPLKLKGSGTSIDLLTSEIFEVLRVTDQGISLFSKDRAVRQREGLKKRYDIIDFDDSGEGGSLTGDIAPGKEALPIGILRTLCELSKTQVIFLPPEKRDTNYLDLFFGNSLPYRRRDEKGRISGSLFSLQNPDPPSLIASEAHETISLALDTFYTNVLLPFMESTEMALSEKSKPSEFQEFVKEDLFRFLSRQKDLFTIVGSQLRAAEDQSINLQIFLEPVMRKMRLTEALIRNGFVEITTSVNFVSIDVKKTLEESTERLCQYLGAKMMKAF